MVTTSETVGEGGRPDTMTLDELLLELESSRAFAFWWPVVIRSERGDHTVAAVHLDRERQRVVVDLGIPEQGE